MNAQQPTIDDDGSFRRTPNARTPRPYTSQSLRIRAWNLAALD